MENGTVPASMTPGQMKDLASAVVQGIPNNLSFDQVTTLIGQKEYLSRVVQKVMRELTGLHDPIIDQDGIGYIYTVFVFDKRQYRLFIGPFSSVDHRHEFMNKWLGGHFHIRLWAPCAKTEYGTIKNIIAPEDFRGFIPLLDQVKPSKYLAQLILRSALTDENIANLSCGEINLDMARKLRNGEIDPLPKWQTISTLLTSLRLTPEELGYTLFKGP